MGQDGHLPDYVRDDAASPHGLSAHGAERAWAGAPHGRLDFGQAPLRRGTPSLGSSSSPSLSRAPSLSSTTPTAAEGYMTLDEFTRLVEASSSPGLRADHAGLDVQCLDLIVPMLSDGVVANPALDVVVPRLDLPCCDTGMLLR
ncbi:hypothetical protein M885DRAFT_569799 [Pelagophyceae sp. CCMP2097]|nr:hypothetical protein M885DRAFT_569799 [Pelagophyceae sp. CCMP2097]